MPKEDDLESNSKHVSRESTCTDAENVRAEKAPEPKPEVEIVELEGEENPRQWRLRKKATMLALASLFSLLSPLASSITAPCIPLVLDEFHRSSQLYGAWILSVYVLGYAFGPILCAPLSELYGRQVVYHSFNSLFLVFIIACAVAPSIESLIGFRFLAGVAGACAITLGSATIGDMIVPARRGIAIGLFAVGPLAGPAIGPIVGGFVAQAKGWRWVYWVLAMALGALLLVSYVLARETYAPVLLRRKIRRLHGPDALAPGAKIKRPSLARTLINAISRPLQLLFLSPIVMCLSLYSTFVYGIYYLFLTTMSETFEETYGFSRDTVGLAFIGLGVGSCTGTLACGAVADLLYKRISAKGVYRPEHRLIPLIPCTLFTPIGLFWFGWSVAGKAHWIVPIIGTVFIGVGLAASFMPMNYLIDAYPKYAASAVAANTILRSIGGAVLPLAGPSLYRTLGQGWGNSLLAFLSLLACPMALALFKYGERLRLRSRFNSND